MKPGTYVTITAEMVGLGLKGTEIIVYAIIYGFSQDEESWFTGSINYIAEWTGTSKRTVITILKELEEDGYIVRQTREGRTSKIRVTTSAERIDWMKAHHKRPEHWKNKTKQWLD